MQLHTSLHAQQVEKSPLLTENKMGGPDPSREQHMAFKKRTRTILKKAHELATFSGANVYFIIDHPRVTVTYNSAKKGRHWHPADELLIDFFETHVRSFFSWQDLRNTIILVCNKFLLPPWILRVRTPMRRNLGDSANISLTEPRCSSHWMRNSGVIHGRQQTTQTETKVWVKLCMLQKGPVLCNSELKNMSKDIHVATGDLKTWHKWACSYSYKFASGYSISGPGLNYYDLWKYKYMKGSWRLLTRKRIAMKKVACIEKSQLAFKRKILSIFVLWYGTNCIIHQSIFVGHVTKSALSLCTRNYKLYF